MPVPVFNHFRLTALPSIEPNQYDSEQLIEKIRIQIEEVFCRVDFLWNFSL